MNEELYTLYLQQSNRIRKKTSVCVDYIVFTTFLLFSGNPVLRPFEKYGWCALGLMGLYELLFNHKLFQKDILIRKNFQTIIIAAAIVFIGQTFNYGWNSIVMITLFYAKMFAGLYVVLRLKDRLKDIYLNVIWGISIYSLLFWLLWLMKWDVPFLYDYGGGDTLFLFYCRRHNELIRNCGAFWEPGVFACYINFLLFFWSGNLNLLWNKHKYKSIFILFALLSTQSTTGYLSLSVYLGAYFLISLKSKKKYILFPAFITLFLYVYQRIEFLEEKVEFQKEMAMEAKGEFDSSRLGSMLFDFYYIKKNPLFGNGLHHEMRWADHMWLWDAWQTHEIDRSGSGFSDFIAAMGIPFVLLLFILSYRYNNGIGKRNIFCAFLMIILLLMGEPLMLYPLMLSFPLYKIAPPIVKYKFIS